MSDKRVVIVTGGARGIGLGIGRCFAQQGASIVVADVNEEQAKAAAEQLHEAGSPEAMGVACDVTQRDSVEAMVEQVMQRFGQIDVLVNNAGICPFVEVMEIEPAVWQKTLEVNLTGSYLCTQAVGRRMIDAGRGGRIIFITSLSENFTNANQGDYAASKAGLRMAMKSFCIALGPHGITCNAVAPGHILTDMTRHHWEKPEPAAYIKQRVPVGRIGTPEDIGRACVLLASKEAAYISGTTLTVDGGYSARCE